VHSQATTPWIRPISSSEDISLPVYIQLSYMTFKLWLSLSKIEEQKGDRIIAFILYPAKTL
jgi:hypothetical protein